jgi:hypothetical protein
MKYTSVILIYKLNFLQSLYWDRPTIPTGKIQPHPSLSLYPLGLLEPSSSFSAINDPPMPSIPTLCKSSQAQILTLYVKLPTSFFLNFSILSSSSEQLDGSRRSNPLTTEDLSNGCSPKNPICGSPSPACVKDECVRTCNIIYEKSDILNN